MGLVQLSELRTRVRSLADAENDAHITDVDLDAWINEGADELYELLLDPDDSPYFLTSTAFNTVANQEFYTFATLTSGATFFKLQGLDMQAPGDPYQRPLKRYAFGERGRYKNALLPPGGRPRYHIEGAGVRFLPAPTGIWPGTIWWHPTRTKLVNANDTLDGYGGWETFVIEYAAIRCKVKSEEVINELAALREQTRKRVERSAHKRDPGTPAQVVDVSAFDDEVYL